MNSVASESVRAFCPACLAEKTVDLADLDLDVTCRACGVIFRVGRRRVRRLASHQPRTKFLAAPWEQRPSPPPADSRRAFTAVLVLLLLGIVVMLLVLNWSAIAAATAPHLESFREWGEGPK